MTVSTEVDHNDYTGNGVTTSFPYTFRIFKKSDLVVQVVDLNENITELILDTDYTVTGAGGYSGGNVILMAALANGYQISISRELPVTQETDLRNQGKFFAEVHEDAFDKLTMLIQQVRSWLSLALRKPSFVANYYDALNNYIRNLRDPSLPQDAATKNYVDSLSGTNLNRSLRVPEAFISMLPDAEGRRNKTLSFDNSGSPLLLDPASSGLWGYVLIDSFQAGASITTRFEALHWQLPDGNGEYYRWDGSLPKTVPAGSTPDSTGGVGTGAWVGVGDASLRSDLTKYGATIDQIAHRVTTLKSFEEFGAVGDGVTNDTTAMLAALSWLEGVPFGKLTGRVGAKYRIRQSLVMKFDGSYTQDVTSTRYIDFTGTTIVAGASGITCLRMSHDFCIVTNPAVVNPDGFTEVVAYAISPEDPTQTTTRVSQQFCQLNNPKATDVSVGVLLQPGPTISGANSGAYYHTIKNPVFENVDCGFRFNRSVSGDNSNTRITIYTPVHVTGNCAFWIESTDSLRVFGGSCENITKTTGPADVPCAVRVVKTVNSDTSVAGNLRFYGYFGELCTRGYQIDDNVGTYNNFFDWGWVYLDQEPYRPVGNTHSSIAEFDGAVVSSNWDPNQPNISGCRRRKTGKQAVIIQSDDTSPAELYSDTKWKFTSSVLEAPVQDLRNNNSGIQILGATDAGILVTTATGTKGATLSSYDGKTSSGNPNGDLKIGGYNGFMPDTDNTTVLGYTSHRWSVVYAATGTISTSDETLKVKTPATNENAEREAANEIRKNIIRYKFTDAIKLKGEESARVHFGVGAQTVGSILTKHGLKPEDYAFWCKDEWEASSQIIINPETLEEVVTVKPAGVRYGIRYDELIMFLMSYVD
ncbi:hypothetical protein ACW0LR_004167 [Citrobacter freundii]